MKKLTQLLTLACTAALTLTACTSDDVVELGSNDGRIPIAFTTSQVRWGGGVDTRTYKNSVPEGFYVYAEKSNGEALFDDDWVRVNRDGSFYDSSNAGKYFWPDDGVLTFYAFDDDLLPTSRFSKSKVTVGNGTMSIDEPEYNASTNYAAVAITKCTEKTPVVPLRFKCVMADVSVLLKNSREDTFKIMVSHTSGTRKVVSVDTTMLSFMDVIDESDPTIVASLNSSEELNITTNFNVHYDHYTTLDAWRNNVGSDDVYLSSTSYAVGGSSFSISFFARTLTATQPYDMEKDDFLSLYVTYLKAKNDAELWKGQLYLPLNGITLESGKHYDFIVDLAKGGYVEDPENPGQYVYLFGILPISFAPGIDTWGDPVEVKVTE